MRTFIKWSAPALGAGILASVAGCPGPGTSTSATSTGATTSASTTTAGTGGMGGQGGTGGQGGSAGGVCGVAPTKSGATCVLPAIIAADLTLGSECQPWHIAAAGTQVFDPTKPVLTIKPCVTIEVDPGGSLLVAGGGPGGLVAVGTAKQPITFTSSAATPMAGDWGPVAILDQALYPTTTLAFVDFEYGGGNFGNGPQGTLVVDDSNQRLIELRDLTLSHNLIDGIHLMGAAGTTGIGFAPGSGNLTIKDWGTGHSPILLDQGDAAATVPATLTTGASGHDGQVELAAEHGTGAIVVEATGTWASLPIPYLLDGPTQVVGAGAPGPTLTIAAPNTIQFAPGAAFLVAGSGGPGGLVAVGTAQHHITFTSSAKAPKAGDWGPFVIGDQALYPTTTLAFVDFEYGGGNFGNGPQGTLVVDSTQATLIELHDLTLAHNLLDAIHLMGAVATPGVGFAKGSGNLTIKDWGTGHSPILLDQGDAAATVPSTLTTGASGHDGQVEIANAHGAASATVDVSGTWASLPIPYLLDGYLQIEGAGNTAATLTIAAPNVIQFPATGQIVVDPAATDQGYLVANGTNGNLVFTSSSAAPAPGDWLGLWFYVGPGGQAASSVTGCTLEYAGGAGSQDATDCAGGGTCTDAPVVLMGSCLMPFVAGPTISGNTIKDYPATDSGFILEGTPTNAASYANNTFGGAAPNICNN